MDIIELLDVKAKSFITMIGGGGKTTGMFLLANQLEKCAITSTTKLFRPPINEKIQPTKWEPELVLNNPVQNKIPLFYTTKEGEKYLGITPEDAVNLFESFGFDHVLCEGDGARMKSLKVWKKGEPVIPSCTTHTIINIGAKVLGKTWGPEYVHRSELLPFQNREINFELLLEMMERKIFSFNTPATSKNYLIFNQWDIVDGRFKKQAKEFAQRAKEIEPGIEKVLFVSYRANEIYDVVG